MSGAGGTVWENGTSQHSGGSVARATISALRAGDSPRLTGVNDEHARALAESGAHLPPILVHRATMRVIDGMHRIRAAQLRGDDTIEVRYFDGPEYDAFLLGVKENIAHGLPLTLADRRAVAGRILRLRPQWSDRAVAAAAGLSHKTVGALRRRCSDDRDPGAHGAGQTRIGRDGRWRSANSGEARKQASQFLAEDPGGTVGVVMPLQSSGEFPQSKARFGLDGLGHVRVHGNTTDRKAQPTKPDDSRFALQGFTAELGSGDPAQNQVDTGSDASTREPELRGSQESAMYDLASATGREGRDNEHVIVFKELQKDPSLRLSETGRTLLRMLSIHCLEYQQWERIIANIPPHCAPKVAGLATECADKWRSFAAQLNMSNDTRA